MADFFCKSCNARSTDWKGRCPSCGTWNSYIKAGNSRSINYAGSVVAVTDVSGSAYERKSTNFREFDRVVGGGVVEGGVYLLGGEPGSGKSTLVSQVAGEVSKQESSKEHPVLYVCGEESPSQVKMRISRLNLLNEHLLMVPETEIVVLTEIIKSYRPSLVVVDSIQSMFLSEIKSSPGSPSQVVESAKRLLQIAKTMDVPMVIVCHVTKSNDLSGPRALEHLVDTVLFMDGSRGQPIRFLRSVKDRFSDAMEIAVLELSGNGLIGIPDPTRIFSRSREKPVCGAVSTVIPLGQRMVACEVQALVCKKEAGAKRITNGMDHWRLHILLNCIKQHGGLTLDIGDYDVYISVMGGMDIENRGGDLAIVLAIFSAFYQIPLSDIIAIGEVALTGEIVQMGVDMTRLGDVDKERLVVPKNGSTIKNIFKQLTPPPTVH